MLNSPSNLKLPIWIQVLEILVTEDQHLALSSKQRKLVQSLFRELRKLDAVNLSAKVRAEVARLHVGCKEVGLGWVCAEARIVML